MTDFVTSYLAWLKSQFSCRETGAYTEITTPFLDRHNDQIQIYALPTADGWSLTDAGETLSDLEMSGVRFESPKRRVLLLEVLQGFGVTLKNNELTVAADQQSRPQQINNLIQAMLSVNDLFCLAQPTVYQFFTEDVTRTPFESHEQPLPQLRKAGRLQLDRYARNTACDVRVLRAVKRRGGDSGRRADVVEAIRLGPRTLEAEGAIHGTAGGVIRRISEAATPLTSNAPVPKSTPAEFPLYRFASSHDTLQPNFSCIGSHA